MTEYERLSLQFLGQIASGIHLMASAISTAPEKQQWLADAVNQQREQLNALNSALQAAQEPKSKEDKP